MWDSLGPKFLLQETSLGGSSLLCSKCLNLGALRKYKESTLRRFTLKELTPHLGKQDASLCCDAALTHVSKRSVKCLCVIICTVEMGSLIYRPTQLKHGSTCPECTWVAWFRTFTVCVCVVFLFVCLFFNPQALSPSFEFGKYFWKLNSLVTW